MKEILEKLAKLNKLKESLDRDLKEVYKQIIEVKQSVDKQLTGLCFRNQDFYYKIIVDTGCSIDYVICHLHTGFPNNSYMSIITDADKIFFLEQEYEVITNEEFNKALEDTCNKLKELY